MVDNKSPLLEYYLIKYRTFIDTLEYNYKEDDVFKKDVLEVFNFFKDNLLMFKNNMNK